MKQPEYIEGKHALENFEEGMKALFKAPKAKVASLKKKPKPVSAIRKRKKQADKD